MISVTWWKIHQGSSEFLASACWRWLVLEGIDMDDMPSRELVKKMKTRRGFIQYGWEMAMLPVNVHFLGAQSLQKTPDGVVIFRSLVRIFGGFKQAQSSKWIPPKSRTAWRFCWWNPSFHMGSSVSKKIFLADRDILNGVHVRFLVVSVSNKTCEWRFTKN